jgi:SAM-dependent methyltransferase
MIQTWKIPHMVKGTLTWVPVFNAWRLRRGSTGGTDSARYCYSAWLRHLVTLAPYGFRINGARVGELGPGDSIGIGLAALLSGAAQYTALDIVPFSAKANLETIFDELLNMYLRQEPIPDNNEFPCLEPRLDSHDFPRHVLELSNLSARSQEIRNELTAGLSGGQPLLSYKAPWTSVGDIDPASLDLIFSQAVLEHVDDLDETYQAMFVWLEPGGYASHVIDFSAHHLSPFWNGHWAYSDREWQLVRGQREFLLNRKPLSAHLACAEKVGFEILSIDRLRDNGGLNTKGLSERFQALNCDDARTRGAVLVLQKR